jgi:hypothetical protein
LESGKELVDKDGTFSASEEGTVQVGLLEILQNSERTAGVG